MDDHLEPQQTAEATYRETGERLVASVRIALPIWITEQVSARVGDRVPVPAERLESVIDTVVDRVTGRIRTMVAEGVDSTRSGPLELIRTSLDPVTELLDDLDAPTAPRDELDRSFRPADRHGLGPMTFAELGPAVHDAGIEWGAAKAFLHLRRRGAEGPSDPSRRHPLD